MCSVASGTAAFGLSAVPFLLQVTVDRAVDGLTGLHLKQILRGSDLRIGY